MTQKIKAAGYIRVSSAGQVENESLENQTNKIKKYCKANEHQLTEVYADKGISGGTVSERDALLRALHDAQSNKFDVLIINDLSRFGRNARELLENHQELKQYGIKLRSIKEGMDFDTPIGKAMLTMLAAIAELELTMIKERMLENRIAKARKGYPTAGGLPFGRTFDKEKKEWDVDQNKVDALEWVYQEYVKKDRSLQQIALDIEDRFGFSITYAYLVTVLKEKCGPDWQVEFEQEDAANIVIDYKVPRTLSSSKVKAIKDRLAHNRTNNRTDVKNKYLLTGFIRCVECHKSLYGQSQHGGKYQYYVHPNGKAETCDAFGSVPLSEVEQEVFRMIFDDIGDTASFERAIKDSLPDIAFINELEDKITADQAHLKNVQKSMDNLIDTVKAGAFEMADIKEEADKLKARKKHLQNEISATQNRLNELPDIPEVKKQAHHIRENLLDKYQSKEHFDEMSFDEKKQLLHFLFEGKAPNGKQYGIYIDKLDSGEIRYSLFGRLRAYKATDTDGPGGDKGGRKRLFDVGSSHSNTPYKTNNIGASQNEHHGVKDIGSKKKLEIW